MTNREPPTIDAIPKLKRRRFPLAILCIFLILLGTGIYLAWPAIEGGLSRPKFSPQEQEESLGNSSSEITKKVLSSNVKETEEIIPNDEIVINQKNTEDFNKEGIYLPQEMIDSFNNRLVALETIILNQKDQVIENTKARKSFAGEIKLVGNRLNEFETNSFQDKKLTIMSSNNDQNERIEKIEQSLAQTENLTRLKEFGKIADDARKEMIYLNKRVQDLEARLAGKDENIHAAVVQSLAAGKLWVSANNSRDFTAEIAALRSSSAEDIEINNILDSMEPLAIGVVPAIETLHSRFAEVAESIIRTRNKVLDDDWISETITELKNIVVVRRIRGNFSPESLDLKLIQAEQALSVGNLKMALEIIEPYKKLGVVSLNKWLEDANRRLQLDSLLLEINQILLVRAKTLNATD